MDSYGAGLAYSQSGHQSAVTSGEIIQEISVLTDTCDELFGTVQTLTARVRDLTNEVTAMHGLLRQVAGDLAAVRQNASASATAASASAASATAASASAATASAASASATAASATAASASAASASAASATAEQ